MACSGLIDRKGRVSIPHEIRKRLGLKEWDRLEFISQRDLTVIRPVRSAENPFEVYVIGRRQHVYDVVMARRRQRLCGPF